MQYSKRVDMLLASSWVICPPACPPACLPARPPASRPACLSVCVRACVCVCVCVCVYVCVCVCAPVGLSASVHVRQVVLLTPATHRRVLFRLFHP